MWGGTAQDLSRCGGFVEGDSATSPGVRGVGSHRRCDPGETPQRAGRGRSTQLHHSVTGLSEMSQSLPLNTAM